MRMISTSIETVILVLTHAGNCSSMDDVETILFYSEILDLADRKEGDPRCALS